MVASGTLFRLAAVAWLVVALATPLLAALGEAGDGSDSVGVPLRIIALAIALNLALAAALWLRPGRASALIAVLWALYNLLAIPAIPDMPAWQVILVAVSLPTFPLSAACLWVSVRRSNA